MDFLKILAEERQKLLGNIQSKGPLLNIKEDININLGTERSSSLSTTSCDEKIQQNYCILVNKQYHPSEFCIQDFRISFETVEGIFYVPDFVDLENEAKILSILDNIDWKVLTSRKSKLFGNIIQSSNLKKEDDYCSSEIPAWLVSFIDGLVKLEIFPEHLRPDSILINKYNPMEGILHHTDGPGYYDRVAILSLRSDCIMSFRRKFLTEDIGGDVFAGDIFSVILRSCSLLYFTGDVYSKHMHGIAAEPSMQQISKEYGTCLNAPSADTTVTVCINWNSRHHYPLIHNICLQSYLMFQVLRGDRISLTFRKVKAEFI